MRYALLVPFIVAAIVSGCAMTPSGCLSFQQVIQTTMLLPETPERAKRLEYYKALYAAGGCLAAHDPVLIDEDSLTPKAQ